MKQFHLLIVFVFSFLLNKVEAQVSLTATSGTLTGSYTTLKAAFDAINMGTHKGDIMIELTASTTEGATPATLLSGDADPTNYTSVYIYPSADGISISGSPGAGFGVIQLNGADNVIIDGDNPNTAGINRNLTVNNTSASTAGYTSCLRVATLAGASAFADNIFLFNCNFIGNVTSGNASGITATTSSSNTSFGLYFGGKGGTTTPAAITSETADAALAGTTINNVVIDNVSINQCGRGIVFNGAATTVSSSLSITNNVIGASAVISGYPVTSPASTVYTKGIWIAGCAAVLVNGNTIQNIMSYVSTTISGVEMASNIGSTLDITGNTITGVLNNGTGGTANGVLVSSVGNRFTVGSNTISNVQAALPTSASPTVGVNIATTGGSADVTKNKISGVYNRNTGGYGAIGVHLSTAANASEITNNFIYDIMNIGNASFTTVTENATGILVSSGSSHKIYHNSVHLSGTSTATASNMISCFTSASTAVASLDIRNNIFSNTVSGGAANNAHVCMYFPFASSSALGYIINNNAYYTGSTAGLSGLAFAGANTYNAANLYLVANFNPTFTTPATNFRNWSSATGTSGNDFASFGSTAAAPFVSSTDLHIVAGPTQLESGGVSTSIADDIDATGRGTYPDIGADEFTGTIQDLTSPLITYTPFGGTCVLGNRTLTVNITDPSGVPTSGGGLPVLYWRINAGAYAAVTATSLGGGNYSFTFGAGAIVGDIVSYYIVARDNAAALNTIAAPSGGAGGYTPTPPAAATPPTTPESYSVQSNLPPGTYTVGGAGVYTTLTAAINAYNNSCLSGAIIFELLDATYSTSETFPIVIGNPVASAVNTLTIRPAAGVNATITGSSATAILKFNGADYVTIDGSNNGTSSQNLTIVNTDASSAAAVIWVASASSSNGSTNNVLKNSIVRGSGTTSSYAGIISGGGTNVGDVAAVANSSNSYQNITVHTANMGIALLGVAAGDNSNSITQSRVGSTVLAEKIGFRGIFLFNQTNVTVTNNTVLGITSTFSSNSNVAAGISVRGAISNGVIASNVISDCKHTNTAGWTVHGITLQSTSSNSGLSVYNNFIYDIAGFGYDPNVTDNGHGIGILSGGGYKIYYNSVNLTTNQSEGNTAAIFIDNRAATGVTPSNLDIRNNIFANSQTSFVRYSIYSAAPASAFTNIDYNDYYTTGSTLGFLGSARVNLAAWQSATGGDANSVSVIPQFTSATNLHLLGSSTLNNLGVPLAGFITDIDTDIRNATTPDIGADEFTPPACSGVITGGTITASKTTLCVSESVTFSSTGFSFGTGMSYQWESSPDNSTWSPIAGETNPLTLTITISSGTYYRLSATCSNNATTGYSNVIQVTVSSPSITASSGGSVCGLGTVNLTATGSIGTTLRWYDVLTGGSPVATGGSYTTPTISSTTTYYVEAVSGLSTNSVGPSSPTAQGGTIVTGFPGMANWRMFFEVIQTATLLSVDIFPQVAGQAGTIGVYNSGGTLLASQAYTTSASGGATAQTITFAVPPTLPLGVGYYIASVVQPGDMFTRNSSGSAYPYTSSAINITGTDLGPTSYAYYYNWQFSTGCPSAPRTAVVATVSSPPAFTTPTASPTTVCEGASSNLTSLDADYSTYSWAPTAGLSNPAIANPVATPSSTTTYTVTVSNGVCATSADVTVTVNPTPTALTISPAGPIAFCSGAAAQLLTTSGGSGDLFRERFNAFPISKFTITGNGVTENQNTTYYQDASGSVQLTHQNSVTSANPGSYEMTNSINMTLYSNSVLTFYHIAALEDGFDYGFVEYSTDNGTSWTPFPTSSYSGSGTLKNGVVSYDASSYADWLSQVGTGGNPGAGPAAALWKLETINLAPWQTATQFKVRFRIQSDGSVLYYGWLIDDVKINSQATITWAPVADLFTNAAGTIPYVGGSNASSVYTKPTVNRTYTATAAFGACPATANVTVNVTSNPLSITIASAQGTTVCGADTVDLSIPAQNLQSGTPFYDWKKNGTTITGSATGGSSVGTTVTVTSTATLFPGMRVSVSAGIGFFQANTIITNILSATQFTVNLAPTIALSGATVSAIATGSTVTTLRYADLANGDIITCVLSVGGTPNPCIPANPVTSNSLTFTILATTATSVSISATNTTICATESVTFTATPTNGGAAPTYEWFIGSTSQGAPSVSNTFTTTTLANGNVVTCRMYSNAANCPFPKAPYSNAVTMTVNPSFPVSVSITSVPAPSGSTVSICNGTSVTFTATPTNGGVTPLYEWFVNGTSQGAPSGVNTFTTTTLADLDVVTCELTSSISSCALGNPATSNTLDISVTTQPASVTITPSTPICAGISRTYTATPTNGGATPTYQWYVNSSPVGTNSATYTYTPTNGDVVAVDMSSSLSCATPIPASTSITQTVNALPTASITGNNILCPGIPVLLNSNALAGSGSITSIQWRLGGSNISGATSATYTATAVGNYDVVVTNSNGCTVTSAVFTITAAATPLSGTYYIGRITAANVNGATTTLTTTSTANLVVGALLTRVTGTGTFAANTIVTSIIDATTFTVNNAPSVAMSGAGIGGADCDDYLSFVTAISDLNTRSISGNCTFNVQPGYIENIAAQLVLGNATLNAAAASRTIIFQKNGAGANPLINAAFVGTSTIGAGAPDGIWSINGTDNITIDGVDINDNNTTNATVCMDFGYGLFKLNNTDGVQNNTIRNCTITLNRVNNASGSVVTASLPGSNGIVMLNSTRTSAVTALTAGGAVGANSNNKFYSNTIQNCNTGIGLSGLAAASPFTDADVNNDVGGASAATANTIINFGGAVGATQAAAGIVASNQWGVNISYNTINNNNGAGANHVTVLRGIYGLASTSASATISNNTITLNSGGTTTAVVGIDNAIGSTAASNTLNINNNIISGSYTTATTGTFTGITNSATAATVNINSNTVQNITLPGSGAFIAIGNTAAVPTTLNINSNNITGNTKSAGTVMTLISGGSPAATATTSINSNTVSGNTMVAGATNPTLLGIQLGGTSTYTINNNTINNNSVTGLTGAAAVTLSGISNAGGTQNETISGNTISNLFVTGTSTGTQTVRGVHNNTTGTSTRNVSLNTIFNIYTSSGLTALVTGINSQLGGTTAISRNWIYNLFPGQSATAGSIAKGIAISSGGAATTNTVSNNMIALDLTLAASSTGSVAANSVLTGTDALRGIEMTSTIANSNISLYFNSIRLAGNGAGNFGSSGVFHTASTTATTAALTMTNNLIDNETTPNGTGLAVAYRRSAGAANNLANFAAASNNNMLYAGTPGANNLIYYDGTSTAQTITAYTGGVFTAGTIAPRESASLSDISNFVSQTDLHVNVADNCALNNTGTPLAITIDYDNNVRNNPPDIGADEFVGTGAFGTWAGVNTNWNDPVNWCGGVPTATTSVIIPTAPNYPVITGYTALSNNITITGSGVITIGAGGILRMNGNITSGAGTITATAGTVQLNGTAAQTLRADHFVSSTIDSIIISNTSVGGVTIDNTGGMLFVTSGVSFGANNNQKFNTSNLLTLRSTVTKTARVADVTNNSVNTGNDVVGKVVIERYIPAKRAWRLLTAPVKSSTSPTPTFYNNWQESSRSYPLGTLADPVPGYGTHISNGNNVPDFDQNNTNNPSVYYLTSTGWNGVPSNTSGTIIGGNNGVITDQPGYMLFVRGNRSTNLALGTGAPASATTLRTTGDINVTTNAAAPLVIAGSGGLPNGANYNFVYPNPYPSAISFESFRNEPLNSGLTLNNTFYVWDANLTGSNGVGGWITVTRTGPGAYTTSPTASIPGLINGQIQSGMAFMVLHTTTTAPSLRYKEAFKVGGSNILLYRPHNSQIRTTLIAKNADGTTSVNDGALLYFDGVSSNEVDIQDGYKVDNFAENICIVNKGVKIAIEKRNSIAESDTIFLSMYKMRNKSYTLSFDLGGLSACVEGKVAMLEDQYLKTKTLLNMDGNTEYNFSVVPNTASADSGRFRIVFMKMVQFAGVEATVVNDDVAVNWNISNELNIDRYEIERSVNGTSFETLGSQLSRGNTEQGAVYSWLDVYPPSGVYYYRIKATGKNGIVLYSDVAKVTIIKRNPEIFVFPNPVINNVIGLQLTKMPKGTYEAVLMSEDGKVVNRSRFTHAGGTATQSIKPAYLLPAGNYRLEILSPEKKTTVLSLMVQKQ